MYICIKMINDKNQIPEGFWFKPEFPEIKGLELKWTDESNHSGPIFVKKENSYEPLFYGVCDDDANINVAGVVSALTEQEYKDALRLEKYKVPHRETWVFDEVKLCWLPPLPYPSDGFQHEWDEATQSWIKVN